MFYSFSKTVTHGTAEATKEKLEIPVSAGIIHQVDFIFPSDSSKDLNIQIYDANFQLWPSNRGNAIRGDNMVVSFREWYHVDPWNNKLILYAWNSHATDDLLFILNLGILPEEILMPFSLARLIKELEVKK